MQSVQNEEASEGISTPISLNIWRNSDDKHDKLLQPL